MDIQINKSDKIEQPVHIDLKIRLLTMVYTANAGPITMI